jgi:hypothetical protein
MDQTIPNHDLKSKSALFIDAKRAFTLVANHYVIPLGLPDRSDRIHQHFHFVEASRWAYYLRFNARFNVPEINAGQVEAVTHSYETGPKIGVNKSYHTFGTLVHESIHFFSHYAFRQAFDVSGYEGATEYLTRKLLNDLGPRCDVSGDNNMYAREITPLLAIVTSDEIHDLLCQAYFLGNGETIATLQNDLAKWHIRYQLDQIGSP